MTTFSAGKLIDWTIVERLLIPAVVIMGCLIFRRGNPKWRANITKLKLAAETAKIRLSGVESLNVTVDLEGHNRDRFPFECHCRDRHGAAGGALVQAVDQALQKGV